MRWIVLFEETPDFAAIRSVHEAAHLAYLEQHRDEIPMAGGLREAAGDAFVGGLWVFEVASRSRALALIEADPYYQAHPRPFRLLAWGKALPQFHVLM